MNRRVVSAASLERGKDVVQKLILSHEQNLRRYISRRSDADGVEDLFQETVRSALQSADAFEYRDEPRFLAWIYTIASRAITRTHRRDHRVGQLLRIKARDSSGPGVSENELIAAGRSPSSIAAGNERLAALLQAVNGLGEPNRTAVILAKFHQLTIKQVAKTINRSTEATAKLVARSIGRVSKELRDGSVVKRA